MINSLPAEVRYKIFSYLPMVDLRRFQQLNSSIKVIAKNFIKESKPTFGLVIGNQFLEYYHIFLKTKSSLIDLFFDGTGRLKSLSQEVIFVKLREDFEAFVDRHQDRPKAKDVFLTWLFSRIDVSSLQIIHSGKYREIAADLLAAMQVQPFRCLKIASTQAVIPPFPLGSLRSEPGREFITEFCKLQREYGVPIQLHVTAWDAPLRHFDVELLNESTADFPDILYETDHTAIHLSLGAIVTRWNLGKIAPLPALQSVDFRVRFNFEHGDLQLYRSGRDAENFLSMRYTIFALEGITEEEVWDMDNIYSFDMLPEEFVCRHLHDGSALKFKLAKQGRHAILTVEID